MGEFSHQVLYLFSRAAAEQGGVISGANPSVYDSSDPFKLWIIQLIIIVAMTQFLSLVLSRLHQPKVIAEVIAGVLLGPTAMGRIPGFTQAIFPEASLPVLRLTSTIGLILFLFLVGLEIDTRLMRKNVMSSVSVSVAGLVVPLGMGAALGVGLYREFMNPNVNLGHFLLFVAVSVGITAFPVLCRILTELKLLDTEVGLVTLSAGIGNDIVGWVLLALTVALVNASSGLTALWVLLAGTGYAIFLLFPGRWSIHWLARRTGSLEQGSPTVFMMTIILFVIFISAFYTDIIGIHPIFGGFLAGLVVPHHNGFAISIVEKLEDLVSITLLPLYFALSGLSTDLGLLNTGVIWGYVILICLVAFSSKFLACATAARLTGYGWREAGAVGALMSCKGLVELIALNIGREANILTTQTFSMFVMHALILTLVTMPLVMVFYPAKYRVHFKTGKADEDGPTSTIPSSSYDSHKSRFALLLDKAEALPPAMALTQLLHPPATSSGSSLYSSADEKVADFEEGSVSIAYHAPGIKIEALRLLELTSRTSAVLRSQEAKTLIYNDPITSVYTTFGRLNNFKISVEVSVVNSDEFADTIAKHVLDTNSQMVIIPWPRGHVTVAGGGPDPGLQGTPQNPFDPAFRRTSSQDQTKSVVYSKHIRKVFSSCPTDVALFVDRGLTSGFSGPTKQHLFLPFFGGPDDRLALSFLVQLCERPSVTATVVRITKTDPLMSPTPGLTLPSARSSIDSVETVYVQQNPQTRLASGTADNLLWDRYTSSKQNHPFNIASALSRISFRTESTPAPLRQVVEMVKAEETLNQSDSYHWKAFIVLAGRSRRMADASLTADLRTISSDGAPISSSVPTTLGDVGAALVAAGVNASLLILQASPSHSS